MANVFAKDLKATGDEPTRYHVEQTDSWQTADAVAKHCAKYTDPARWSFTPEYTARNGEPYWNSKDHWMEQPNVPGEGVETE